jgi:hypothetical protein
MPCFVRRDSLRMRTYMHHESGVVHVSVRRKRMQRAVPEASVGLQSGLPGHVRILLYRIRLRDERQERVLAGDA